MKLLVVCLCMIGLFFPTSTSAHDVSRSVGHLNGLPLLLQGIPGFSITPAPPIDFGPSAVGETTPHASPIPLSINNPGTATLTISGFSLPPEFAFTSETTFWFPPPPIDPGLSLQFNMLFTPQGAGLRTGQLIVTDNAPGSPHAVQLTGTGVNVPANDFAIILDPGTTSPVSVAAGSTTTFPVWLLAGPNLGNTMLTLQCSAGSNGCNLDGASAFLRGDSFSETREKIMVSLSVPPRSALLTGRPSAAGFRWRLFLGSAFLLLCTALKHGRRVPIAVAVLSMAALLVSCGGSGSSSPANNSIGAANSNVIVITASPTSGTAHSLSVPLNVH